VIQVPVPYIRTRYLVLGTLRYSRYLSYRIFLLRPTVVACHSFSLAPGLLPSSARYPLFTCRTFYADATCRNIFYVDSTATSTYDRRPTILPTAPTALRPYGPYYEQYQVLIVARGIPYGALRTSFLFLPFTAIFNPPLRLPYTSDDGQTTVHFLRQS